jgi:hypothetical protein
VRRAFVIASGVLVLLTGCGTHGTTERAAAEIRQVLERARTALLQNEPSRVCNLLTAHGRRRSLGFQVDFAEEGTAVPSKDSRLPQTCEAVVEREWTSARRSGAQSWPLDLRHARFAVVSVEGATARAQLEVVKPYGPVIGFTLRKTASGWRIDDSDAVPEGY